MDRVIVVGGGPGGATAAAVLAKLGVPVTLYEKESFPRHHLGESLQPATFTLLRHHLGLDLHDQGFPRKYGAVYVWGQNRDPWTVLFDPRLEAERPRLDALAAQDPASAEAALLAGPYEHAWNVDRARFDTLLLERAGTAGADIVQAEVSGPVVEGDRVVGVRVRGGSGEHVERARVVIDASGQHRLLGRALSELVAVPDMNATATYAYYDGAGGVPGVLGRHVQWVVTVPDGWIWFIPVAPDRTSVGIVCRERARMDEDRFDRLLEASGLPIRAATPVRTSGQKLRFVRDWSFCHRRLVGPGWALVGDAACFVDPILSGGVDFAVRGGCQAALAAARVVGGEPELELFAQYQDCVLRDYQAYLRLARYWYGNNRSVEGLFWEAHREIPPGASYTPARAFVYLTTGHLAADRHLKVFQEWQERKIFRQLGVDSDALRRARRSSGAG